VRNWRAVTSQTDHGSGLDWDPFPGQSFGVNGALVWIFLDELRELDLDRAIEVWEAYAVAQERGHAEARAAAEHVADKQRPQAWTAAREAASQAVRERLGASPVTNEVADILADVAGSLVVRDLLSRQDFRQLQFPWTSRAGSERALAEDAEAEPEAAPEPEGAAAVAAAAGVEAAPTVEMAPVVEGPPGVEAAPATETAAEEWARVSAAAAAAAAVEWPQASEVAPVAEAAPVVEAARVGARSKLPKREQPFVAVTANATGRPGIGAILGRAADQLASNSFARTATRAIVVIAAVLVLAIVTRFAPDAALFGPGDSDVPGSGLVIGGGPSPAGSAVALASPSTRPRSTSSAPGATAGPSPSKATTPTVVPPTHPPPPPPPTPAPTPAPTPKPTCTVPLLNGVSTTQAPNRWAAAGFTGTIFYSPAPPPNYKIQWQSLTPGSKALCTHDINVSDHAP
jgi:hypothetical protein